MNTHFRRTGLEIFERLLKEPDYWKEYGAKNGIPNSKEEKVWQYFFRKNEWIFGYGLDYRFQSILQWEAHLSSENIDGSDAVIADYLLGDKRFTTFIEIKKPRTSLFNQFKNRSNSWTLSNDLFNSVSQILEQKASGLIKMEISSNYVAGELLTQKAYDSKVFLIIGSWQEIEGDTPQEKEIKKRTFELFRRDSRNIDIITYDELFERARFILN